MLHSGGRRTALECKEKEQNLLAGGVLVSILECGLCRCRVGHWWWSWPLLLPLLPLLSLQHWRDSGVKKKQ